MVVRHPVKVMVEGSSPSDPANFWLTKTKNELYLLILVMENTEKHW